MPNSVQYSETEVSNTLNVGNLYMGAPASGPTSVSGFYAGINPPSGGYTVYMNKASGGPSIVCPANDADLIAFTENLTGESMADVNACFAYFASETDKMVMHNPISEMHAADLSAYYTAGSILSYPRSGTSWIDISGEAKNGTLTNGPTFSSNGYFDFDGADDYVSTGIALSTTTYTKIAWFNPDGATANIISGGSDGQHAFWMQNTNTHLRAGHNSTWDRVSYSPGTMTGKWWCGAVTFSTATGWKLYLNGELVDTSDNTSTFSGGTAVRIAAYNNAANLFNGKIATAQIYNKILTAAEISTNYYQGSIVTDNLEFAVDAGNLVSYQNGSTTVHSLKNVSNEGTLTNGVAFSSGNGGGWDFDGVDDYITFGTVGSFLSTEFTFELWLNVTDSTSSKENYTFNYGYSSNSSVLLVSNTSNTGNANLALYYKAAAGGVVGYALGSYSTDEIVHLIIRRDSGGLNTAFVNGVSTGTSFSESTTTVLASGLNVQLGWAIPRNKAGAYFKGKIYQFKIYDTALTTSQITQNYNANVNKFN